MGGVLLPQFKRRHKKLLEEIKKPQEVFLKHQVVFSKTSRSFF